MAGRARGRGAGSRRWKGALAVTRGRRQQRLLPRSSFPFTVYIPLSLLPPLDSSLLTPCAPWRIFSLVAPADDADFTARSMMLSSHGACSAAAASAAFFIKLPA